MQLFNSEYTELGSIETNLVLNTKGKLKIRYGNKFIDLLDEDGYLNPELIRKDNN